MHTIAIVVHATSAIAAFIIGIILIFQRNALRGFVLISLFDGFAIVSALDLQAPGWLVAVIAVGAVGVGIYGINLRKKTLKMQMIQNSSSI